MKSYSLTSESCHPPLQATAEPVGMPSNSMLLCLQHLLTHIEEVYEEGGTIGTAEKFFALVENNVEAMPVSVCVLSSEPVLA